MPHLRCCGFYFQDSQPLRAGLNLWRASGALWQEEEIAEKRDSSTARADASSRKSVRWGECAGAKRKKKSARFARNDSFMTCSARRD